MRIPLSNIRGLTLIELVVSVVISTLLLGGVFYFVTETLEGLARNNARSEFLGSFYSFSRVLNTGDFEILPFNGYSVGILELSDGDEGILFGVVNNTTQRLIDPDNSNMYLPSVIGARRLSEDELNIIASNQSFVYQLDFQRDELFPSFYIYDFQLRSYNDGEIHELVFEIFQNFRDTLEGRPKSEVPILEREVYSIIF